VALLLAVVASLGLGACVGDDDTGGENARKGGSITVVEAQPPDSLDPARAWTRGSREALWLVYTPPLTYRRREGTDGTTLIPGLAEKLPEVSADGLTYRFRFRRGLRYADGTRLHAGDFARTVERARRLNHRAARLYRGVEAIRADDRTRVVTVHLREPDGTFPNVLAATTSGLVPAHTPLRDLTAKPPPGIGPYRIVRSRPGGSFVMRRDRGFRLPGIPDGNVDEIAARVERSRLRRTRDVIDGEADSMQGSPPAGLLPELRSKYEDRYREHTLLAADYAFFDTRRRPFDHETVRRAVSYALDGKGLRRLSKGFLEPGCNVLPPGMPARRALDPCPYGDRSAHPDLVKASRLLADAGEDGASVTVRPGRDPRITRAYLATLVKIGL
jgi:peptide/nickel transport system substrate-binding protein